MAFEHMSESGKHIGDALSIATVVGTLAQVLPSLAALFTIIWTGIRIFETDTVQKLFGKKKVEDVKED
jgi:peptidoglycan biosynthesis protein MviN/MurJ (putative lipid II flippase)